jgi:hypothetical protein
VQLSAWIWRLLRDDAALPELQGADVARWADRLFVRAGDAWEKADSLKAMLPGLPLQPPERRLRLFVVAVCLPALNRPRQERLREAAEACERHAEGSLDDGGLEAAIRAAVPREPYPGERLAAVLWSARPGPISQWAALQAAEKVMAAQAEQAERARIERGCSRQEVAQVYEQSWHKEESRCRGLLRDILGNPFRPPAFDPAWRTPLVRQLALAAYQERTPPAETLDSGRLAVLADALEEAGCTAAGILAHLRAGGDHVRGCWALDLLLGKA